VSAPTRDALVAQFVAGLLARPGDHDTDVAMGVTVSLAEAYADAVLARRPKPALPTGWVDNGGSEGGGRAARKGGGTPGYVSLVDGDVYIDTMSGPEVSLSELRAVLDYLEASS
jgi:hypothetical protein